VLINLEVNDFVVISSIVDLVVVRGIVHLWVPWEVYRPGSWDPSSHLIVVLDWRLWGGWLSDPVENLVIVLGVVETLWPWSSPGVTIHVNWNALRLGLEVHNVIDLLLVGGRSAHASKSNSMISWTSKPNPPVSQSTWTVTPGEDHGHRVSTTLRTMTRFSTGSESQLAHQPQSSITIRWDNGSQEPGL